MLLGLLEYSRVGRAGEPPVWLESRAVLDEALLFLRPAAEEAKAAARVEGDWPRLKASPDGLLRLLQNLIGNALKFRRPGCVPEVMVSGELLPDRWRLTVTDNGIGLPPSQRGSLFQVFSRLRTPTEYEGTGVGLAVARKIAEQHGGSIRAESPGEGLGSSFIVELPLAAAESG
jgi:signal transduction histidine kinase